MLLFVRTAWLCDDAFITLRVVDNFVHGHGLRWNPAERVQVYTHPLWMLALLVAHPIVRDGYFTLIVLSLAVSTAAACVIVCRVARTAAAALLAFAVLSSSKAFVDFSTSGLENPLVHGIAFALAGAWMGAGRRSALAAGLALGLGALARPDAVLLFLPAAAWACARDRARAALPLAIGLAPLLAWECFALVYYGALVPNTALAKLATGLPAADLARQGVHYLADSLRRDPLTLVAIAAGAAYALARAPRRALPLVLGALLHLAWVVLAGGDFMSGRFLTPALALVVGAVAATPPPRRSHGVLAAAACALALGLAADPASWTSAERALARSAGITDASGVGDERRYYGPDTSLVLALRGRALPTDACAEEGRSWRGGGARVEITGSAGFLGYYAGPQCHLVDRNALTDAFLARLPPLHNPGWRTGHHERPIPEAYLAWLRSGEGELADAALRALLDDVTRITRGPLWERERWRAILRRRFGLAAAGPELAYLRHDGIPSRALRRQPGREWAAVLARAAWIGPRGIELACERAKGDAPGRARELRIEVSRAVPLELEWAAGGRVLARTRIGAEAVRRAAPEPLGIPVPRGAAARVDRVRLLSTREGGPTRLVSAKLVRESPRGEEERPR